MHSSGIGSPGTSGLSLGRVTDWLSMCHEVGIPYLRTNPFISSATFVPSSHRTPRLSTETSVRVSGGLLDRGGVLIASLKRQAPRPS